MSYYGLTGKYGKPTITYQNDLGQTVEQSAGIIRNADGTPHMAYEKLKPDVANMLKRWRNGGRKTDDDIRYMQKALKDHGYNVDGMGSAAITNLWSNAMTAGLPSWGSFSSGLRASSSLKNTTKPMTGGGIRTLA